MVLFNFRFRKSIIFTNHYIPLLVIKLGSRKFTRIRFKYLLNFPINLNFNSLPIILKSSFNIYSFITTRERKKMLLIYNLLMIVDFFAHNLENSISRAEGQILPLGHEA